MTALRQQVLSLYRRVLRLSRTWEAVSPVNTTEERIYIKQEAKKLFHKNKKVRNEDEIKQYIREAEARIELAIHYQNPYPRAVNIPQHVLLPQNKSKMKASERTLKQSKPIYMKSYENEEES